MVFKLHPVFLHHCFHCLCYSQRRVAERTASECAKDDNLIAILPCNIKHFSHPLFVQRLQFFLADAHSRVSIIGIHTVTGALPQIRGRAGQYIDRIPLVLRQQLWISGIGLEGNDARRVDAVIIVQRVLLAAMRRVELLPKDFFFEIRIQCGAAADCLLPVPKNLSPHHRPDLPQKQSLWMQTFFPAYGIRHCCFQCAFGTHNDFGRPCIDDCLLLCALDAFRIQLLIFLVLLFDGVAQRTVLFAQSKGIFENLDVFLPSHNSNLFSLGNLILKNCTTFYRSCRCFLIIVPLSWQRCRRVMS